MRIAQLAILTCIICCISVVSWGQNKYTKDADSAFERGGYYEAAEQYKAAYPKLSNVEEKGKACFRIGECFRLMADCGNSTEWYEKAITAQYYKQDEIIYFVYGDCLREQGKFDDAIVQYNKYKDAGGDKTMANGRVADCERAALMVDEPPTRYVVEPLVLLNTPYFDYGAVYSSKKGDEIVFSSSRQETSGTKDDPITGDGFMDLFTSSQDKKGKWSTPVPLNNTINTTSNEGASGFDKKCATMYFTRCVTTPKGNFACDIYWANKSGANYGVAELLPIIERECEGCNDSSQVGHPTLTPDDQNLVFASDMPGGYGGKDLWIISYDKKAKKWSSPKNLGKTINTPKDDMFPFIKEDGTLYFSSTGHSGLGGLDIFSAEKTGDTTWDNVTNLQYPLNSSSDDFGIVFDEDKDQGLFTSNRPGGKGKDDIYSFKMPPIEFCLQGAVYDHESGVPLSNSKVIIQGSDGSSFEIQTDGNGGFSKCDGEIKAETNYSVDVSKTGFIGTGDQFSTVSLTQSTTFAREYFLKEIILKKEYDLPLVLYPFDQAILLVDAQVNSKDSLNFLYDLLTRNPTFVIQLEAHTDSRGKDAYNLTLSQKRAETCVNYLIGKGIDPARLKPVGMGENAPIIKEKDIMAMPTQEEQEAAHQVNRRTVFKIISYDFVPKK
jgi:peptidoglycan-associated lipoprotein